jgi:uncharacterized coiled-coil DUF342 family protein
LLQIKDAIRKELPLLLKEDPEFRFEIYEILSRFFPTREDMQRILEEIKALREESNKRFEEHSKRIDEHSRIIEEHSKRIDEHSKVIARLEITVSAVGARAH